MTISLLSWVHRHKHFWQRSIGVREQTHSARKPWAQWDCPEAQWWNILGQPVCQSKFHCIQLVHPLILSFHPLSAGTVLGGFPWCSSASSHRSPRIHCPGVSCAKYILLPWHLRRLRYLQCQRRHSSRINIVLVTVFSSDWMSLLASASVSSRWLGFEALRSDTSVTRQCGGC